MQPSTPRGDPSYSRPLKYSMVLSSPRGTMAPRPQPHNGISITTMKRSSMPMLENAPVNPAPTFQYIQLPIVQQQPFTASQQERNQSYLQLNSTGQTTPRQNSVLDNSKDNYSKGEPPGTSSNDAAFIREIVKNIQENHFEMWLLPLKQELTQAINELKIGLNALRAEWLQEKKEQTHSFKEQRLEAMRLLEDRMRYSNPAAYKIKKDNDYQELDKQVNCLQDRIARLQNKFGDSFNELLSQLQTLNTTQSGRQESARPSKGMVSSSLPPIVLEYGQHFKVGQQQVRLQSECYFIDQQGYLLDSQCRYLLDYRDQKIRLTKQHIQTLTKHQILRN